MDLSFGVDSKADLIKKLPFGSFNLLNAEFSGYPHLDKNLVLNSNIARLTNLLSHADTHCCCVNIPSGDIEGFLILKSQNFDSHMLGLKVYQITDFGLSKNCGNLIDVIDLLLVGMKQLVSDLKIEYLFHSCDTNHLLSSLIVNQLCCRGFYYLGTLLKFSISKKNQDSFHLVSDSSHGSNLSIRDAVQDDLGAIAKLAKDSYKMDRFHLDPNLPQKRCDLLFEQSTINSLTEGLADILYIAEVNGKVAGYLSARRRFDSTMGFYVGEGMISAVDPSFRGLGIFTKLSNKMWEWFLRNAEFGESGTYINNLPVHKAWTNNTLTMVRGHHQMACYFK